MEGSQTVLNPAVPEIDDTDETVPDADEPNDGLVEESKNEMNEQQESGIMNQVVEEEDPTKPLLSTEEEEPSAIPDTGRRISNGSKEHSVSSRKQSHQSIHNSQRSQQSVGRQSLQSVTQPSKDVGPEESVAWLSQRTGKEMKCKFNQTSLIWERKPLAEILHPSSKMPQISQVTEKDEADAGETITPAQDTENEQGDMQDSLHSMQPLEGMAVQEGGPSPVEQESGHGQQLEEQASQHGSQHTIVTIMSQPAQDRKPSQVQPPSGALMEGGVKLISKKTGQEMKCSFNQTSLIWERKPLAEILRPPSPKAPSPAKDVASPEVREIQQASGQEDTPSTPQTEEPELQPGSQQLEAEESKQEGGQEALEEAPEAPEEAPEAREEAPEAASGGPGEAPEAAPEVPEEAPEAPEEAPEAAPEVPEEAPEATSGAPEEAPEAPGEAPEAAPEVPEEAPEASEEAPEAAPDAPEEAPEASEEAPEAAPDAPEEAPEASEEAPEAAPDAPEEALEAPEEAPETAPETLEEAPES